MRREEYIGRKAEVRSQKSEDGRRKTEESYSDQCHPERSRRVSSRRFGEERSVTSQLNSKRFSSADFTILSLLKMTEDLPLAACSSQLAVDTQCYALSADSSTITVDSSIIAVDHSTIVVDSSTMYVDHSTITVDSSIIYMDNSTMTMDSSMISMDSSTMTMDNSTISVYHSMITMDSSRGSTEEKNKECRIMNNEYGREESRSDQSQCSVRHPELVSGSVTTEQNSKRFLSLFGMSPFDFAQDDSGQWTCSPDKVSGFSLRYNSQLFKLETRSLRLAAKKKLTIKYNNSPTWRVPCNNKISHLSEFKKVGARKQIIIPIFLIQSLFGNDSPLGEMSEGQRGVTGWWYGTIANNLKQGHAYET